MSVDLIADLSDSDVMTQMEASGSELSVAAIPSEAVAVAEPPAGPSAAPPPSPLPLDDFVADLCEPSKLSGSLGRLGQYELLERIGRGGMGVVYRGHDSKLGRDVAIKLLKPRVAADSSFVERFTQEARAAAGIVHHNVVTVHAIDDADGIPYIVMEHVPGESLQKRIRRQGPLPLSLVASLGSQIANGLAAAHARRVTHRDIKPANILLLEGTDEVRLGDFGLARAEGSSRLTKTGVVLGTPRYMSPEQARGDDVDHRSDLFSLGSVLYSMCVGRAPISGRRQADVLSAVAKARINPIEAIDPTLPDWLTAVIRKLHALDPDDRFQSADHVAALLRRPLGEFDQSEMATDDGWHDGTIIPTGATGPAFERRAEDTMVESKMTRVGELSLQTDNPLAEASETELPHVSLVASPVVRQNGRRRGIAGIIGVLFVAALVPVLFSFLGDDQDQEEITPPAPNEVDSRPLPPLEALIPELRFHVPAQNRWYETLQAAIDAATERGVIEIAANGRVVTSTIRVDQSVIIRPAPGHKPVIVLQTENNEDRFVPLFRVTGGTLVLEGLDLEVIPHRQAPGPSMRSRYSAVRTEGGRLLMAHCRVRMPPGDSMQVAVQAEESQLIDIRHCEFFCGTGVGWACPSDATLRIERSVIVSRTAITLRHSASQNTIVELTGNTFINDELIKLLVPSTALRAARQNNPPRGAFSIIVRADDSLVDSREALLMLRPLANKVRPGDGPALPPRDLASLPIYKLLAWQGRNNIYEMSRSYVALAMNSDIQARSADTFESWQQLWRERDQTSRTGSIRCGQHESFSPALVNLSSVKNLRIIRYEGGEPILPFAPPGAIVNRLGPDDYHTWRDSPAGEAIRRAAFQE